MVVSACRVPSGCRVLTYLTDADLLPLRANRGLGYLMNRLGEAPETRILCDLDRWRARAVRFCSAESSRLSQFSGDRWLAAGDAALAFDPLSSIGVLSAAVGGRRAAEAAVRWLGQESSGIDAYAEGATNAWQQYVRELTEQYSLRNSLDNTAVLATASRYIEMNWCKKRKHYAACRSGFLARCG